MQKLLTKECDSFSKSDNGIGNIESLKLKLNVTNSIPVCKPCLKIPTQIYSEMKECIKDLLTNEWINTSYSSYASPMVFVRKKDGTMRLCIDYKDLNKKIHPDRMPIPRIQDILDNLSGQKYFTTLDMSKANH